MASAPTGKLLNIRCTMGCTAETAEGKKKKKIKLKSHDMQLRDWNGPLHIRAGQLELLPRSSDVNSSSPRISEDMSYPIFNVPYSLCFFWFLQTSHYGRPWIHRNTDWIVTVLTGYAEIHAPYKSGYIARR